MFGKRSNQPAAFMVEDINENFYSGTTQPLNAAARNQEVRILCADKNS
jgi:hypothetical protein